MTNFWQYKSFVDIRRRFLVGRFRNWVGRWNRRICRFPVGISS